MDGPAADSLAGIKTSVTRHIVAFIGWTRAIGIRPCGVYRAVKVADPTADIKAGVTGKIVALACRTRAVGISSCGGSRARCRPKIRRPITIAITALGVCPVGLSHCPARSLGIGLNQLGDSGEVIGDLNGFAGTGEWDPDPGSWVGQRVELLTGGGLCPNGRGSDPYQFCLHIVFYNTVAARLARLKIPGEMNK